MTFAVSFIPLSFMCSAARCRFATNRPYESRVISYRDFKSVKPTHSRSLTRSSEDQIWAWKRLNYSSFKTHVINTDIETTNWRLPIVSFSGPLGAQIVWSKGLYNLKQKPSFLLGLSITLQEFSSIVPTQWLP